MLIGRGSELARIGQLLAEARLGTSGVLVIAGEPGVGKTALLRHAVEAARGMTRPAGQGRRVRGRAPVRRPATRCCARRFDRLDALPPRQAAALSGALGLSPGVETRPLPDRRRHAQPARVAGRARAAAGRDRRRPVDRRVVAAAVLFAARRLLADALARC